MIPVRSYLHLVQSRFAPMKGRVAVMSVAVFGGIALKLLAPQLLKRVIDGAIAGAQTNDLLPLILLFLGVALVQQVIAVGAGYLAEDIGWRATNSLRLDLFAHTLHLDMSYHTHHTAGELIERVDGDVTKLSRFFSSMIVHIIGNGVLVIGIVALLFRESLAVGGWVVVLTAAMAYAVSQTHGLVMPWWKAERASSATAMGQVGEMVDGTEDIAANGGRTFMESRYNRVLAAWLPKVRMGWMGWGVTWATQIIWMTLITVGIYWFGSQAFENQSITLGGVYILIAYAEMLASPVQVIRQQLQELQKAGAAVERIEELLATVSAVPSAGETALPDGPLEIVFEDVTFSYPDEPDGAPVLRNITFDVPNRHVLGLVGRTGSGKSTLAKLLAYLQVVDDGTVKIGGVPIGDAANLRDRVAMVTQDVQLIHASVRDNLTFFDPTIDDETVLAAITALGLDQWLEGLDDGLDTIIGGDQLSAGEGQLLAFTRVFLRDPGLVVMDEASSRLDPATEQLLERAVDRLLQDRTAVIIAHRLHTLQRADDILILDDGVVQETGSREALVADPTSRFAQLLTTGMEEVLS